MYIVYALLGAIMASLGTIFAKVGLKGVDSNTLTAIRGIVMALIVSIAALSFGKLSYTTIGSLSQKQWLFVVLSGIGGALSWMFFYFALSSGPTITVSVIDKLSIIFTSLLAVIILGEGISAQTIVGLILVVCGTFLVSFPLNVVKSWIN